MAEEERNYVRVDENGETQDVPTASTEETMEVPQEEEKPKAKKKTAKKKAAKKKATAKERVFTLDDMKEIIQFCKDEEKDIDALMNEAYKQDLFMRKKHPIMQVKKSEENPFDKMMKKHTNLSFSSDLETPASYCCCVCNNDKKSIVVLYHGDFVTDGWDEIDARIKECEKNIAHDLEGGEPAEPMTNEEFQYWTKGSDIEKIKELA